MALAAATAQTWGISGPTFLLAYLLIAAAVGVAGFRARRALADPGTTSPVSDLTAHPHDAAYLNGGGELAVYSALSAMHLRGTITTSRGRVQSVGHVEPDTDALEKAIHLSAFSAVGRKRPMFTRQVKKALAEIEARLVAGGFLLSEDRRRRIRRVGLWTLGVAALGFVRLLAGIAEARPVGFLVIALLVVTAVAVLQLSRAPLRSRHGDRALAALRLEHHTLSPDLKPDWNVYGPAAAALGIGIFGTSALWASDPAFADEIEAQRADAGGWGSYATGGSGGSSGGGGGDSGGGGCGGGGGSGG